MQQTLNTQFSVHGKNVQAGKLNVKDTVSPHFYMHIFRILRKNKPSARQKYYKNDAQNHIFVHATPYFKLFRLQKRAYGLTR